MIVPKRMADMLATRIPHRKTEYRPNLRNIRQEMILSEDSSPVYQDWNKKGGEEESRIHGAQHCTISIRQGQFRLSNLASHFIRVQICQIDFPT